MPSLSNILTFLKDSIPAAILGVLYIFKKEKDNAEAKAVIDDLKIQEITAQQTIDQAHAGELSADTISKYLSEHDTDVPKPKTDD